MAVFVSLFWGGVILLLLSRVPGVTARTKARFSASQAAIASSKTISADTVRAWGEVVAIHRAANNLSGPEEASALLKRSSLINLNNVDPLLADYVKRDAAVADRFMSLNKWAADAINRSDPNNGSLQSLSNAIKAKDELQSIISEMNALGKEEKKVKAALESKYAVHLEEP
jgi:hypothetical protein